MPGSPPTHGAAVGKHGGAMALAFTELSLARAERLGKGSGSATFLMCGERILGPPVREPLLEEVTAVGLPHRA